MIMQKKGGYSSVDIEVFVSRQREPTLRAASLKETVAAIRLLHANIGNKKNL